MKTIPNYLHTSLAILLSLIIVSCSAPDQKAQLEQLKKQRQDLEAKISELEETIAKNDTGNTAIKRIEVAVLPIQKRTFKTYIEVQARVDADQSVSLSSSMPGTVTRIDVKVEDVVSQGQVLAETDSLDSTTNFRFANQL